MIDWTKVKAYFCLKYEIFTVEDDATLNESLYCLFDMLYNVEGLSWRQIAEVTDGYVSSTTLLNKAKNLGITIKSKGGSHCIRKRKIHGLCESEYIAFTNTKLGKRYKVCRQTIMRMAKEKGWPLKKIDKAKVLSAPGEGDGIYQEHH